MLINNKTSMDDFWLYNSIIFTAYYYIQQLIYEFPRLTSFTYGSFNLLDKLRIDIKSKLDKSLPNSPLVRSNYRLCVSVDLTVGNLHTAVPPSPCYATLIPSRTCVIDCKSVIRFYSDKATQPWK